MICNCSPAQALKPRSAPGAQAYAVVQRLFLLSLHAAAWCTCHVLEECLFAHTTARTQDCCKRNCQAQLHPCSPEASTAGAMDGVSRGGTQVVGNRQWSITAMPARRLICRCGTWHANCQDRQCMVTDMHDKSTALKRASACCLACAGAAVGVLLVSVGPGDSQYFRHATSRVLTAGTPLSRRRVKVKLPLLLLPLLSMPLQQSKRPGHRCCRCV